MSASQPSEHGEAFGSMLDVVAGWLAPSRSARRAAVPDFRGMEVNDVWLTALRAGVRLRIVRLTRDPAPTDAWVEGQDPEPGADVRRGKTVTLLVRHPPADARAARRE